MRGLMVRLHICWPHKWSKWVQYLSQISTLHQQRRCGRCHKVQNEMVDINAKVLKWRDAEVSGSE